MNFYYQEYFNIIDVLKNALLSLSIKTINLSDKKDQELYHKIIAKVDEIVKLSNSPNSREKYSIQIQSIDREIDHIVFDLYGVSREEL